MYGSMDCRLVSVMVEIACWRARLQEKHHRVKLFLRDAEISTILEGTRRVLLRRRWCRLSCYEIENAVQNGVDIGEMTQASLARWVG